MSLVIKIISFLFVIFVIEFSGLFINAYNMSTSNSLMDFDIIFYDDYRLQAKGVNGIGIYGIECFYYNKAPVIIKTMTVIGPIPYCYK